MSLELPKLIEHFSEIILSVKVSKFEHFGNSLRLRASITFIDKSTLYIRETVIPGKIRKYAYHWQDKESNLLIRWDNAPDWEVKTFPHHKHMDQEKTVYASYERTLDQVLSVISKNVMPIRA